MRINYLMHKKKADEGEAAAESVIVEVVRVAELGASEYRVGDLAASVVKNAGIRKKQPRSIFVQLQLGKSKVRTAARRLGEDDANGTFSSRHLLDLREDNRTREAAEKTGMMEGSLEFLPKMGVGIQEGEVELMRGFQSTGKVFFKYKFMDFK
eukprot:g2199.t1